MKKILVVLLIGAAVFTYLNFDSVIEKINDLKNPTFDIEMGFSSLEKDGVLTFDVLLKNVTDRPISVDILEVTYIVLLKGKNYTKKTRNILDKKTINLLLLLNMGKY